MKGLKGPLKKPKDFKSTIKDILAYFKDHKLGVGLALILTIIQSFSGAIIPKLFSEMVGSSLGQRDLMLRSALSIFIAAIGYFVFMYSKSLIVIKISQKIINKIRKEAFKSLQESEVSYYDKKGSGSIVSRLTNDIDAMGNAVGEALIQLITSIFLVIFGISFLIISVPFKVAIITFLSIPFLYILLNVTTKNMFKYFGRQQKKLGEVNSLVEESISGMLAIKLYSQEEYFLNKFKEKNLELREATFKASFNSMFLGPLITIFQNILYTIIVVVVLSVYFKNDGGSENLYYMAGIITAATGYTIQILNPVRMLGQLFGNISSGLAGGERVFQLVREASEHKEHETVEIHTIKGDIEFDNVTFSYPNGPKVLKNLRFKVNAGETIAIVGATGSGKTTLINLFSKFYDIDSGKIKIDNIDLATIKRGSLRKNIGVVLQDSYLFEGSVENNIGYSKENSDIGEIIEAAKEANADGFISRLPKGYKSKVQSGGTNFSHGERQLISIARTLLANPSMLILDEATSSVDTRTEKHIIDALEKISKGRTSFVIAHRLQTIKNADRILVIDRGELVEFDTHDELMTKQGYYYQLYTSQFGK